MTFLKGGRILLSAIADRMPEPDRQFVTGLNTVGMSYLQDLLDREGEETFMDRWDAHRASAEVMQE